MLQEKQTNTPAALTQLYTYTRRQLHRVSATTCTQWRDVQSTFSQSNRPLKLRDLLSHFKSWDDTFENCFFMLLIRKDLVIYK